MFIVTLTISDQKREKLGELMPGHNDWLKQGFDDGVFVLAGSLPAGLGGGIVAHGISEADLKKRVDTDPFVTEGVVIPEILEITPSKIDDRLAFLAA